MLWVLDEREHWNGFDMRIGVIGGGLMGLSVAYFLSQPEAEITILEQSPILGGLNSAASLSNGLTIDRYQHSISPHDVNTRALCEELGLGGELVFSAARMGFMHGGSIHPMSSIREFLSFGLLKMSDRLRLGSTIVQAQRTRDWRTLDQISVKEWLVRSSGEEVFNRIWAPLLEAKFDNDYDSVPATYIWTWLNRMSAIRRGVGFRGYVGYLRRGHASLIQALAEAITARGGQICLDTRVRQIEVEAGAHPRVRTNNGVMEFDILIAAVAPPVFAQLLLDGDENLQTSLQSSRYLGLICPALLLNRPLSGYWTLNLTDPSSPFSSIIEVPHPQDPRYTVVYLPKYTVPENDWLGVPDDDIQDAWMLRLRQIFPDLKPEHIQQFIVNRTRYAEPIPTLDVGSQLLPVQTRYPGLLLANTGQVYPSLPTSESAITHAHYIAGLVQRQPVRSTAA